MIQIKHHLNVNGTNQLPPTDDKIARLSFQLKVDKIKKQLMHLLKY